MNLAETYANYTDKQLVEIVENDGYTPRARQVAEELLIERGVSSEELISYATSYFIEFFKKQLQKTILTSLSTPDFPESKYLTQDDLKKIVDVVFDEIQANRGGFYSDLPTG
jgi:hypothetical protein